MYVIVIHGRVATDPYPTYDEAERACEWWRTLFTQVRVRTLPRQAPRRRPH
jgi:hypothetical protein